MPIPSFVCPANDFVNGLPLLESTQSTIWTCPSIPGTTKIPRFTYSNAEFCFCSGWLRSATTCSIVMPECTGPIETPGSITRDALDGNGPGVGFLEQPVNIEADNATIISNVRYVIKRE